MRPNENMLGIVFVVAILIAFLFVVHRCPKGEPVQELCLRICTSEKGETLVKCLNACNDIKPDSKDAG